MYVYVVSNSFCWKVSTIHSNYMCKSVISTVNASLSPHVGVSLNWFFALEDGMSQGLSYRKTITGQGNAGLKQLLPWQPAMPLVCHLITTDLPGNGYGQSTCHVEKAVPVFWISQALSFCLLSDWKNNILRVSKVLWDMISIWLLCKQQQVEGKI